MKLQAPENANYAAVVVQIKNIIPLDNCDNVVGTTLLGFQAIVSKDTKVGDVGIVFPAETQLSEMYCKANNLYRHSERNADPEQKGYLEDNRRVKAVKFRGHRSNALFMPLTSLSWATTEPVRDLKVGDIFDKIGDQEICRKYVVKVPVSRLEKNKQKAKQRRVEERFLPAHFDTDNYWRNKDAIPDNTTVILTIKLHGTSVRLANTLVKRQLKWYEKLARKFGVRVQEIEYDYIAGSRRVIKDPKDTDQNHFYATDIWTESLDKVKGILPEGFVVYGELIGWTKDGTAIQPNYTYGVPRGENVLYVYRVAQVNPQGRLTDLSWDQVKEFCREIGLKYVPEIERGPHDVLMQEKIGWLMDVRFAERGYDTPPLDSPNLVDEGICIRVDGLVPYILKAKSPKFLEHETKLLDKGEVDMESVDG
jgi:RNA ligase